MKKVVYSVSLDGELVLLMRRYKFINWSDVVGKYLSGIIHSYGTELEELLKSHEKTKRGALKLFASERT